MDPAAEQDDHQAQANEDNGDNVINASAALLEAPASLASESVDTQPEDLDSSVEFVAPQVEVVDLTSPTRTSAASNTPNVTSAGAGGTTDGLASSVLLLPAAAQEPSCSRDALKDPNATTTYTSTNTSTTTTTATATATATCSTTDPPTTFANDNPPRHPSSPVAGASATANAAAASAAMTLALAAANALECPICLQTCIHPARLPCGHIFCFLCVKGVAYKNRRCAMCRREIPPEFLDHPQLVNGIEDIFSTRATDDGYQWFYEGRNGWWQYDDRTSQDLEEAFKKGERSCTILVAGYVYIVDFDAMVQQRQNEPARCRRVKRDLATIPKKGVAGLRIEGNTVTTDSNFAQQVYQSRQNRYFSIDNDDLDSPDNSLLRAHSLDSGNVRDPLHLSYDLGGYVIELGNPSEFVSTAAATDAALRIASDIIGSTLAHADELTRSTTSSSSTPQLNAGMDEELHMNSLALMGQHQQQQHQQSQQQQQQQLMQSLPPANALSSSAGGSSSALASPQNSGMHLTRERGSRELLGAAEDLLGATQRVIATADQSTIDLFEQTLNDFHALTLRSIVDSSDDDESFQQQQQQQHRQMPQLPLTAQAQTQTPTQTQTQTQTHTLNPPAATGQRSLPQSPPSSHLSHAAHHGHSAHHSHHSSHTHHNNAQAPQPPQPPQPQQPHASPHRTHSQPHENPQ